MKRLKEKDSHFHYFEIECTIYEDTQYLLYKDIRKTMLRTYKKNLYVQRSTKEKTGFFSNKFFKKTITGLLLLMTIFGSFSPLFGVKKAHAEDNNMGVIWPNEDGGLITSSFGGNGWFNLEEGSGLSDNSNYTLYPKSVSIKKDPNYSANTSAKFNIHLELSDYGGDGYPSGAAADPARDTNKNGKFDTADDFGDWNSILDNNIENSSANGIFLQLIKVGKADATGKFPELQIEKVELARAIKTTDNGKQFNIAKLITVDKIKNPQVKKPLDATVRGVYPPAFASDLLGGPDLRSENYLYDGNTQVASLGLGFEGKIINIGAYFWRFKSIGYQTPKDEGSPFFGRTKFDVVVPIDGLEAGTRYYYRLIIKEDGSLQNAYTAVNSSTYFDTPTDKPTDLNLLESDAGVMSSDTGEATKIAFFKDNIDCSATDASTWFSGCLVKYIWYDFLYRTSSWLLRAAAGLMDVFIAYSLSDIMYRTPSFILGGWTVVRDICNMFFIFILLWTAFKMVVNDSHFHANKVIVNIIIVGLLINFSLFFSKLIIDAGNITARVFYNQITVTGTAQDQITGAVKADAVGVAPKALSEAITSGFGIEQMFSEKTYNKLAAQGGVGTGDMFIIITLGIIVNIIAAWMFFKTSFYFIGRILSLWFAMIFSPAAFTTKILHETEHTAKFGWADWLKNILSASFGAPMFMFFIYLIIRFIGSGFLDGLIDGKDSLDFTGFLIIIILQFMFLIGLIRAASDVAKTMSGMFGGAVAGALEGAAKFAGGAAIGLATGGAALAGSRIFGARAAATLNSPKGDALRQSATMDLKQFENDPKLLAQKKKEQDAAKKKLLALQARSENSFDLRNTKLMGGLSNATGVNFNAGVGSIGLGTDKTAGGWQSVKDRKAFEESKKEERFKKILGDSKVQFNGKTMTAAEAEEASKEMKADIADQEATVKNDAGVKNIEDELKRIESAIRDNKESGNTAANAALIAQRTAEEQNLKDRKTVLSTAFNDKMKQKWGGKGVDDANSVQAVADALAKEGREAKNGYVKDYMRNGVYHRQRAENNSRFLTRDNIGRIAASMGTGALAGAAIAGPLGAVVGTLTGAFGGGRLSVIQSLLRSVDRRLDTDLSGRTSYNAATHDVEAGHVHEPHAAHGGYHTPHGAFLDRIFNGGGGGGHSSGGGHGGGGGHH